MGGGWDTGVRDGGRVGSGGLRCGGVLMKGGYDGVRIIGKEGRGRVGKGGEDRGRGE